MVYNHANIIIIILHRYFLSFDWLAFSLWTIIHKRLPEIETIRNGMFSFRHSMCQSVSLSVWLFGHFFTIGMWTMTFEQFMINRCHLITLDLYQSIIICYEYSNNNQQLHTCLLCWSITNLLTISMTVADGGGGGGWIEWIDCKLKIFTIRNCKYIAHWIQLRRQSNWMFIDEEKRILNLVQHSIIIIITTITQCWSLFWLPSSIVDDSYRRHA